MEGWGKITEKGCYTLTPQLAKRLLDLSFETGQSQSYHVREALDLYFQRLELQEKGVDGLKTRISKQE